MLETPDDKTVVFHFDQPRPDLPQALAMAGYSIVPEKADTKEKYDKAPKSLGPYKIAEHGSRASR
ncbi:ABC transporter substrate-binding protein [Streptomyces hirsutus]